MSLTVSLHSICPGLFMDKDWIPLLGFFIVTACHSVVMGIILVLLGELFPTDIRAISIGIVTGVEYLTFAFATGTFPVLLEWLHFYGLNFYYAAVCLLMTIWGMMTIKDTDHLSLVDIELIYSTNMKKSEGCSYESKTKGPNYGSFE